MMLGKEMARAAKLFGKKLGIFFAVGRSAAEEHYVSRYDASLVDSDLVFLESFWGSKIACNPYAVYRTLRDDPAHGRLRFVWSADRHAAIPPDVAADPRVSFVRRNSVEYARTLLCAGHIVSNSTLPEFFIRKPEQRYLNTWHGIPLKRMGYDADPRPTTVANSQHNFLHASCIFLASDYAVETTVKPYGAYEHTGQNVMVGGSPRIDLTLSGRREDIRRRLGVTEGKRVVLVAPTWRGVIGEIRKESESLRVLMSVLKSQLGDGFEVLLSAHNFILKELRKNAPDIGFLPGDIDINEVLCAADVLVSDYSSIVVDFLVLDRPIVLYVPDRVQYESERGMYLPVNELPATQVEALGSLVAAVASAPAPSTFPQYEMIRKRLIPHEDGKASARAAAALLSDIPPTRRADRRKKLAIYAGNMKTNGITSSFLNLVNSIDHTQVQVTAIFGSGVLENVPTALDNFWKINPACQLIVWREVLLGSAAEIAAFNRVRRQKEFSKRADWQLLEAAFRRSARKFFADLTFDSAVDFSGYNERWSLLMAHANSRFKVAYQHNDLMAEARNHDHYRDMEHLSNVFDTYRYFDRIVSVSPELKDVNLRNLGQFYRATDAARSVRNTIVPSVIRARASMEFDATAAGVSHPDTLGDCTKFVMVGRVSPEKNPMRMLDAMKLVVAAGERAVLYVVGDGPLLGAAKQKARALKLVNNVFFCGALSNPFPLVNACDCLLMSSDYEGQPMVILEALTLGKGVIACDIPGTRNSLQGGYGLLVEKTPAGLAKGITDFIAGRVMFKPFDAEAYAMECVQEFLRECGMKDGEPG